MHKPRWNRRTVGLAAQMFRKGQGRAKIALAYFKRFGHAWSIPTAPDMYRYLFTRSRSGINPDLIKLFEHKPPEEALANFQDWQWRSAAARGKMKVAAKDMWARRTPEARGKAMEPLHTDAARDNLSSSTRRRWASVSRGRRAQVAAKGWKGATEAERKARVAKAHVALPPKEARKMLQAWFADLTPEERSEIAAKGWRNLPEEEREAHKARLREVCASYWSNASARLVQAFRTLGKASFVAALEGPEGAHFIRTCAAAVRALPEGQREVMQAHFFKGKLLETIAAETKVPERQLRDQLNAAFRRLATDSRLTRLS